MKFNGQFNNKEFQNDNSSDIGEKIAFAGAIITTIGDFLAVVGAAIAFEESKIADEQQKQQIDNLQSQIDELKAQSQNNEPSVNIETLNQLMGQIVDKLDRFDHPEKK